MVFAALVDGGARLLGRVLPIERGWRVAIVMLLTVAFLGWLAWFAGSQIADQAAELPSTVQSQAVRMLRWLKLHGLLVSNENLPSFAEKAFGGIGEVTRAVGGLIGGATTVFLIVVLGIYFAVEPRLYQRGLAWMLPLDKRAYFEGTATLMAKALRRLLAGRLLGMGVEGFFTWVMLQVYGVPMAALLGLLTGLLAFLPNIGAPISGALMHHRLYRRAGGGREHHRADGRQEDRRPGPGAGPGCAADHGRAVRPARPDPGRSAGGHDQGRAGTPVRP